MQTFVVYRRGYNAANQSAIRGGPETRIVANVQAEDEASACRDALAAGVTVYNNQHLFARPADEVQAEEDALAKRVELID